MPAPTNTSAATAVDLGAVLPVTVTQNVNDSGTTYTVWYKYTARVGDDVIGGFAFGDLVAYTAETFVFSPDGATPYYITTGASNAPFELPVTAGQTYYFQIVSQGGNVATALLTFTMQRSPHNSTPVGSIMISDDRGGFPATVLSPHDGAVLSFHTFPTSELGDVLNTGELCYIELTSLRPQFFDANLNLVAAPALAFAGPVSTNKVDKFYIGNAGAGAVHAKVTTANKFGVQGPTTWTFPQAGLVAMAPSPDETILYFTGQSSAINASVGRWDLVNNVALADLVTGGIATYNTSQIVVLSDGTVLVGYWRSGVNFIVKHYSAAGATLNTYTFGLASTVSTVMCRALDDPASFWVYSTLPTAVGTVRPQNVRVSDGVTLTTFDIANFEFGIYSPPITATPTAFFGPPNSCPIVILRNPTMQPGCPGDV